MEQFRMLKFNDNCIYIFKDQLEVIIHSADGVIVGESFLQPGGSGLQWSLFCLTEDGHVFRVGHKQAKTVQRAVPEDNQGIFTDLLDSTEEDGDELGVSVHGYTKPVYVLQPSDVILQVSDKAVQLCVTEHMLAVVVNDEKEYCTYLYEISEQFKEKNMSITKQAKVLKINKSNCHSRDTDRKTGVVLKAAVQITSDKNKSIVHSTDQILLEESLFVDVFGKEAFILGLPVILLCVPEGGVYFASAKSFVFQNTEQISDNTMHGMERPADVRWNVLCETASPVVDVLQISCEDAKTGTDNSGQGSAVASHETLVLCCESGLVLVYFPGKLGHSGTVVSESVVTSPVVVANSFHNKLYHSTGGQVYETSFVVKTGANDGNKPSVVISQTKVFKYAGITAILCTPVQGYINHKDCPCMLTCATRQGQLKDIKSTDFGDDVATVTGSQIRDVLLAMERVDTEKRKIQKVLQEQDHVLQQVNIAVNLLRWNSLNTPPKTDTLQELTEKSASSMPREQSSSWHKAFGFVPTARLYSGNDGKEIQLSLEITNQLGVSLSCDWKFMMKLCPLSEISSQVDVMSVSQALTEDFKPKDSFSLIVRVKPEFVLQGFTLTVVAILCLGDNFDWLKKNKLSSDWSGSVRCLSAPIYREEVDVLYFLLPNTYESKQLCLGKESTKGVGRNILKIAETKPMYNLYKDSLGPEPTCGAGVSLSHQVHMTESTYKQLQNQHGKGLGSLLRYLLKNSPSVPPPTGTDCSALTVLGQVAHLSVSNMAAVAMERGVKAVHVEVKVRSEASTAAAIHAAVVNRMKSLHNDACRPPVPVRELRKTLHQLQELQEEVQSFSGHKGSAEDTVKLASLYEKLRSVQIA